MDETVWNLKHEAQVQGRCGRTPDALTVNQRWLLSLLLKLPLNPVFFFRDNIYPIRPLWQTSAQYNGQIPKMLGNWAMPGLHYSVWVFSLEVSVDRGRRKWGLSGQRFMASSPVCTHSQPPRASVQVLDALWPPHKCLPQRAVALGL